MNDINACSGDCRLNDPPRCPHVESCASVTQIMRSQRRFLHMHDKYVRPRDQRKQGPNLAEMVVLSYLPGSLFFLSEMPDLVSGDYQLVMDKQTGHMALIDTYRCDNVRAEIESYFSANAHNPFQGFWVC